MRCKSKRPNRRTSAAAFEDDPPDPDDPLLGFDPYIHTAPRRNSITPARQRAFIAALAASGVVTQAARAIGASLEALYALRHRHGAEGFSAAWDAALDRGIARLEDCALERAMLGEERPVVSQGKLVTTYRRYDTALILFLLKQRRRDRFDAGAPWLRPGSAAWKKLRAEFAAEVDDENDVLEGLDAKLGLMRDRLLADRARREAEANGEALDADDDADREEEDDDDTWGGAASAPPGRYLPRPPRVRSP